MDSLAAAGFYGGANLSSFRPQLTRPRPSPPLSPPGLLRSQHRARERKRAAPLRWVSASSSSSSSSSTPSEATATATAAGSSSPGLYSAKVHELTPENVNWVLEDIRPYLIADGGNVDVVSVEDGVISLKLQGACGSCPSSTTTMKMGIEKVLKEKFGEAVKDIRQVADDVTTETTVEAVNNHLAILRPAIRNYGGSVEVFSVEGSDCHVRYVGPDSIGTGIKAAIKEKFPDIVNVILTN